DANDKACQFFGLIKNRLEGVDLRDIFGSIGWRETISKIAQGSTAEGLETVYTCRDGRQITLQSSSSNITYRGTGATLAIFRDVTQHKRDADALRNSQALMTSVLDCLPQRIFCKDLDGKYTVANKSFADWNGLRSDEIVGRTDRELYPEEVASKYMADDRSVLERGKPWDVVEEVLSQDGERIFIEVLKTPQLDETGKTLGVLGSFWDITDKKLTEENLGRERDFLTALMDSIPDAIYFKDRDAKMTRINKAQATLLGLSDPSQAVGKTVFDFFGEAAPAFHEDDQRIL